MTTDILAILVTTVASEFAFNAGGRVIDPHRSSLGTKIVDMLICGSDWYHHHSFPSPPEHRPPPSPEQRSPPSPEKCPIASLEYHSPPFLSFKTTTSLSLPSFFSNQIHIPLSHPGSKISDEDGFRPLSRISRMVSNYEDMIKNNEDLMESVKPPLGVLREDRFFFSSETITDSGIWCSSSSPVHHHRSPSARVSRSMKKSLTHIKIREEAEFSPIHRPNSRVFTFRARYCVA
ncbi:unnamed protein product [Lactuca saligna]|uniref:HAT C-terminal dimerisation domain-containing protein n=1 Tax=Lactuca saligna TaxID=75948 RepID=A0AA36DUP1_LACSI|nr:unnamed protein product [Lactuca saligna]